MMTISVCMIVKNEEAVLERCLASLEGIYDELIIVDTGSSDHTKEIAFKYCNKVYDFPWNDNFSDARNYSFSLATKDYIYVADADEVLEPEEREKFIKLKKVLLPEIEIVQMYYGNQLEFNTTYNFDKELRPKLYKRLRTFTWIDPIHEAVRLDPVVYDSDIVISHRPISTHSTRDFSIYQRLIKEGVALSDKLLKMYARELYISGTDKDFMDAEAYFASCLTETADKDHLELIYSILIRCARACNDLKKLYTLSIKVMASELAVSEICYEIGEYYYGQKEYQEALMWFYNAAYECKSILNIHYEGDYSLQRIADCYGKLNNQKEEDSYREKAKEWSSKP